MTEPLDPLLEVLASRPSPDQSTRLATVTGAVTSAGILVQFDGEGTASTRRYVVAAGAAPLVGERAVMLRAGSTWVCIGVVGSDSGPLALPLATNYTAYGGAWAAPQYAKAGGIVTVWGLVGRTASTAAAGSTCATLPSGFRPPADLVFEQHLGGAAERVDVYTSGAIVHMQTGLVVGGYLSLSGISFRV